MMKFATLIIETLQFMEIIKDFSIKKTMRIGFHQEFDSRVIITNRS